MRIENTLSILRELQDSGGADVVPEVARVLGEAKASIGLERLLDWLQTLALSADPRQVRAQSLRLAPAPSTGGTEKDFDGQSNSATTASSAGGTSLPAPAQTGYELRPERERSHE